MSSFSVCRNLRRSKDVTDRCSTYLDFSDTEETSSAVAKLLRQHGIIYSVINACESARADRGTRANLAKIFAQGGIPHVFAMSYKLQISAVKILLDAFYGSFLKSGSTFAESAAVARKAMRETRTRIAKFGVELELEDWVVPVVYTSSDIDPGIKTSKKLASSPERSWASRTGRKQSCLPALPSFRGRDSDILKLENTLLENESGGRGRLLLLSGKSGCGKTALLRFLQSWWFVTGWTLEAIYIDMEGSGIETPDQLCKLIYKKHARKGLAPFKSLGNRPLHNLLQDMYDAQEGPQQSKRKPLLILDHLPSVFPIRRWKDKDLHAYKAKADGWKSFLADLSSAPAYTIVASYYFPWYIDKHPRTEWPWDTYIVLGPPNSTSFRLAEQTGGERSIKGLLKSPRDAEMLEMVSKWSGECFLLQQAMTALTKESGLETTVQSLQSNADLLRCSTFNSSAIRSQKVFRIAQELWKHCLSTEKSILLSFAPFHGYLPRCYESYTRSFCLGRLELRHPVRDWWFNRAPKLSVDQSWEMINRSTCFLVNAAAAPLVIRLKTAGLIEAVAMCGPTHMDDNIDPLLRGQAEGTKIYSIHPVFTIFLRHQAHREGFGRLGCLDERAMFLTRNFVQYHDARVSEWFQGLGTGSLPWDTYIESYHGRQNFVSALEHKLSNTSLMRHNACPIPIFLGWCLMTSNGLNSQFVTTRFSPDVLAGYCTKAWPHAVDRLSAVVKGSQAISSGYLTIATTLTPIVQLAIIFLGRHLTANNMDLFRQGLADLDAVLETIPYDLSLLCAFCPGGELAKMVEVVDKYRQISNGQDSCASMTICELVSGTPERNEILTENWTIIARCVCVFRDAMTLHEKDEAFSFWDNAAQESEVRSITSKSDSIFAALAPNFEKFLAELDEETLTKFRILGFTQAEKWDNQNDPSTTAMIQALQSNAILPPNYASCVIDCLQGGRPLSQAHAEFNRELSLWLGRMKERSSLLRRFDIVSPASLPDDMSRVYFEVTQVKCCILMNDYQSLKEYLDLVAVEIRNKPLGSLDASQLRHRIWWYNVKGLCAIKLQDWQDANHHLQEAVRLAPHRPGDTTHILTQILFSSLRLIIVLYNSCSDRAIFEKNESFAASTYWKVVFTALILGYQPDQKIYACNGVLLTLLIQAASKEMSNTPDSVPQDILHAIISATAVRQKPLEQWVDLFQSVLSLRRRCTNISLEFFHTLKQLLETATSDAEASRQVMKEAELHVFRHETTREYANCGCRFAVDRSEWKGQLSSLECLMPLLPSFDRLEYWMVIPCLNGVGIMLELWLGNKFRTPTESLDEQPSLEYLSEWHVGARD